jgi:hypothetical protein
VSKPATLIACAANCVALLLCAAAIAAAQTPPRPVATPATPPVTIAPPAPSPAPSPTVATTATGEPDLSITANVTARELLFEVVPSPRVEFPGQPRRDTVWDAERINLPAQVQPGVTYRDIGIRLKITSVFADIERIVAEALGEIPVSDDAAPKTDSNENTLPPAVAPLAKDEATPPSSPGLAPASIPLTRTTAASSPAQAGRPRANRGSARARGERP